MSFFSSSEGDWTGLVLVLRVGRLGDSTGPGKCRLKEEPPNELDDEDKVDDDDPADDDDDDDDELDELDEEAKLDDELELELDAEDDEEAGAAFSSRKLS